MARRFLLLGSLIEAELLAGDVLAAKDREHSVEHSIKLLMPHLTVLSRMYCLMARRLLVGAVVVVKEREHSVEHGHHFVNFVRLVHSLFCLIDQVQKAPKGDEAVAFNDFPEPGMHAIKLWSTPCQ